MLKFNSLLLFLLSLMLFCWNPAFGTKRGIQKVEIKTKSGETVGLYEESHALVIGASNYTNGWPKLPGVIDDVYAVRDALEMHGFIVHIVEDPADYNALDDAFTSFISKYGRKPDNRLLFYFSGHGHTEKNYGEEMGYIVPTVSPNPNRDLDGFLDTAMDMQQIEVYAKRIRSKHALFLFDSCFSGSLFALSRAIPENISYKTAKPVRQFITSGSAEEEVPDRSIFRRQFVAALNGEGDTDGDRYITAIELGEFLQKSVVNYSRNAQHPQYGKIRNPNLDKGDFVFALSKSLQKKDSTIAKIAPATSAFLPDDEMWKEMKNSKNAEDFEDFLTAFPESKLAHAARLKLRKIKRLQKEDKLESSSEDSISPEQRTALKEYRIKILESFQTRDYVSGLEWAEKGLKVAVKRSDKIFILKMKGSLHFLLEEKDEALEMWEHVQRLDPEDEEVRQMLENLE